MPLGQKKSTLPSAKRVAGMISSEHLVCSNPDLLLFGTCSYHVSKPNIEGDACLCDHTQHYHQEWSQDSSQTCWFLWVWEPSCGCWSPGAHGFCLLHRHTNPNTHIHEQLQKNLIREYSWAMQHNVMVVAVLLSGNRISVQSIGDNTPGLSVWR
jgi:hypothetical protein